MRATSKIAINVLSSYSALGLSILINVLLIPFVIHYIGKELYGLIALAISMQALVMLVGSGMSQAMCRYFSLKHAQGDIEGLNAYYANSVAITIGILTPIIALLTFGIVKFGVPLLDIPEGHKIHVVYLILLLCAFAVSQILAIPYMAICMGVQRLYLEHLCLIAGRLCCAVIIVAILPLRQNLVVYGIAYLVSSLVRLTMLYFIAKHIFPFCKFRLGLVNVRIILSVFSVSTQAFLPALSASVYTQVNQIIVNTFLGAVYNTYLAVCLIWQALAWQILNAVGSAAAPQITTYQAEGRWDLIGKGLCRITKYSGMIIIPLSAVLAILPHAVFGVWLGEGYQASISIMPWFAGSLVFLGFQIPVALMLIALGRNRLPSILAPIIAALNLVTVLLFVAKYKFGLEAIAIIMFICVFVRLGLFQTWYAAKECRLSQRKYLLKGYLKPVL
ncbi:MAG: MATE family efflux transporter, partial [Planctomycetota bacterium]